MGISNIVASGSVVLSILALVVAVFANRWMAKQLRLTSAIALVNWMEEARPDRQRL